MDVEAFLKMDLFFFVTTTVVVVLGLLMTLFLYYLVKIARDVSHVVAKLKKEALNIASDVAQIRTDVKDGVATAKEYTKSIASASLVKGATRLIESYIEKTMNSDDDEPKKKTRKKSTTKPTKKKKKDEN